MLRLRYLERQFGREGMTMSISTLRITPHGNKQLRTVALARYPKYVMKKGSTDTYASTVGFTDSSTSTKGYVQVLWVKSAWSLEEQEQTLQKSQYSYRYYTPYMGSLRYREPTGHMSARQVMRRDVTR